MVSMISWQHVAEVEQYCSPEGARPPPAYGHTARLCRFPYGLAKKIFPPPTPTKNNCFSCFIYKGPALGPHLPRTHKRGPAGPPA